MARENPGADILRLIGLLEPFLREVGAASDLKSSGDGDGGRHGIALLEGREQTGVRNARLIDEIGSDVRRVAQNVALAEVFRIDSPALAECEVACRQR